MKPKRPKVYDLERFRDLRPRARRHSIYLPRIKEGEMIEFIRGLIQSPGVRQALAALAFAVAAYVVGALGVTPPLP